MKVLTRFHSLVLTLVLGILLVTALAFMLVTRIAVTREMTRAVEKSILNVRSLLQRNIESHGRDLEFFRHYARERYRQQLRNVISLVETNVDFYHSMALQGVLSVPQAQQLALQSIELMRYGDNDYFFIYSEDGIAISHADPRIRGRDMTGSKDVRGQPIYAKLRAGADRNGDCFLDIWWPRLNTTNAFLKLIYARWYRPWQWLIGTGVYIDSIESDAAQKQAQMMDNLRDVLAQTRLGETGSFWIFRGDGEILIPPQCPTGRPATTATEWTPDRLRRLMEAAATPGRPWVDKDNPADSSCGKSSRRLTYVEHFPPLDWYIAASIFENDLRRPAMRVVRRQTLSLLLVVILCMAAACALVARVTGPIARLIRHAGALAANDFIVTDENARELVSITFPQEIVNLAETLRNMEQRLKLYIDNLRETTAAKERIQSELRIAHDIQMSMLPDPAQCATLLKGRPIELDARLKPALEVGGDFFDFFLVGERTLGLAVGDVAGKGVPAALYMALCSALMRTTAAAQTRPDEVLRLVNRELCQGNEMCMFVTAFLAFLDTESGMLSYANAGHLWPYVIGPAGRVTPLTPPPAQPLGLRPKALFPIQQHQLQEGETLFLYTDGVTEAVDAQAAFYTEERLAAFLQQFTDPAPRVVVPALFNEMERFAHGAPQADDITTLVCRFTHTPAAPGQPPATP